MYDNLARPMPKCWFHVTLDGQIHSSVKPLTVSELDQGFAPWETLAMINIDCIATAAEVAQTVIEAQESKIAVAQKAIDQALTPSH